MFQESARRSEIGINRRRYCGYFIPRITFVGVLPDLRSPGVKVVEQFAVEVILDLAGQIGRIPWFEYKTSLAFNDFLLHRSDICDTSGHSKALSKQKYSTLQYLRVSQNKS